MGSNRFRIDMPRLIEFYEQGRLNLDDMISVAASSRTSTRHSAR